MTPNVILAIGQSTTLTVQYTAMLDGLPTAVVTGNATLITVGAVTSNGNNSYSVVVTAVQSGIATVTFNGSAGGNPITTVSGAVIVETPATSITITGPTSPVILGQTYNYTITANGMIDTLNPTVTWSGPGTAQVTIGAVQGEPTTGSTPIWTVPVTMNGATNGIPIVLSAQATVNGQLLSSNISITLPAPLIMITPPVLSMVSGYGTTATITTNFLSTDIPLMSSSGNVLPSSLSIGSTPNQWTSVITATGSGPGTISATSVYNGIVVNTQVNVSVVSSLNATTGFSLPTNIVPVTPPVIP